MAGSAWYQRLCNVFGVPGDGNQRVQLPSGYLDHRRTPWRLRLSAAEEGFLVSYGDYLYTNSRVSLSVLLFVTYSIEFIRFTYCI